MAAIEDQRATLERSDEDAAPWTDSQRTGPWTLAGRYMRLFWHPVHRSDDLAPGRTVPLHIMSEDFTLYRGEDGKPHALAFRCAHRGTQLSTGWVEGDNLRCFYHGWTYDPSGQCVEQPAEPEPFCQRIKIRSYPAEEYLGLIFVYMGEGEPPALPRYPDFETERGFEVNIYRRRCNFFNHLDNDNVHTWFVHRRANHDFKQWLGTGKMPSTQSTVDEWGLTVENLDPDGRVNITHRGMPNLVLRKHNPGDHSSPRMEHTLTWEVPVDDETHYFIQVDVALRPDEAPRPTHSAAWVDPDDLAMEVLDGKLAKEAVSGIRAVAAYGDGRVTDMVKFQDSVSQVGQGRIADRAEEHLGATDEKVILWRKLWERELRAFAEGRPLTQWFRPERAIEGV